MATLTGKKIKNSYKDLLQVSNSNSGIDSTLRTISDGEATDSVLQLSSSAVNISSAGALQYAGTAITATAAELNALDGITATVSELNILDGVTSTASELNILDGVTSTAAELNVLDGYTGSVTELNYLDTLHATGVTNTEFDYLDGVTSNIQTQLDATLDTAGTLIDISSTTININYQIATGGFNTVNITTTSADFLPSWSLAAGDYDANGYTDLLYGAGNGVTFMKANNDGTAFTEISGPENVFSQRSNFVDINNDGFLDAFVCHDVAPSVSYINDGSNNLVFNNTNGLGNYPSGGNYASVWIDFDNDRDIDMFMAKCGGSEARRTNQLFRNNGDGTFTDIGPSCNLADIIQTWSAAWGDFDNDGDMDAYVGSSTGYDHKLMRNNGDNTFTDVTSGSGVSTAKIGHENVPGDFDNDGKLDIYSNGSILFGNGDMTFNVFNSLTIPSTGAIGDINNDGFLDMFNGNVYYNNANANHWIKIVTIGQTGTGFSNINGIGARVEINTANGTQIRDVRSGEGFRFMHSLNTHFGIGTETSIILAIWLSGNY